MNAQMIKWVEARQQEYPTEGDADTMAQVKRMREADKALLQALKEPAKPAPKELTGRIELRNYLTAYSNGNRLRGAEAELNKELSLSDDTQVPWEALLPLEERTDAATNITQNTFAKNQQAILPRIFEQTDANWLGISMPSVRSGTLVYPVMTAGTSASAKSANASVDAIAATFSAVTINPTRIAARYLFNLEGVAELGSVLEPTLRRDLRLAMGDQLDEQIINGSGTAPNVSGILHALTNAATPSEVATWATYRNLPIDAIDGKMARSESGIRFLLGNATYKHARKTYAEASETTPENIDAIEAMRALGSRIRASAKLPAASSNVQQAVQVLEPSAAVAPVWQGLTIIRDPYTHSSSAQVAMTAHMLFGFAFKRKDGWKELRFKLA